MGKEHTIITIASHYPLNFEDYRDKVAPNDFVVWCKAELRRPFRVGGGFNIVLESKTCGFLLCPDVPLNAGINKLVNDMFLLCSNSLWSIALILKNVFFSSYNNVWSNWGLVREKDYVWYRLSGN